ncbi:MAG: hypothetical protein ACRC9V_07605 [Aeromonas sp.]
MKKIILALACAAALSGCGDDVSGKYAGTWAKKGTTITITDKGDHYDTFRDSKSFGKRSFVTKEDADGYLIRDDGTNQRYLKYKDANTLTYPTDNEELKRVK